MYVTDSNPELQWS